MSSRLFKGAQGHRASLARRARCRRPRPPPRRGLASGGSSASRRPAETLSLLESSSYSPRTVELRPGWPSASQAGRADARAPTSNGCAASPGRAHGRSESIPHPHRRRIEVVLELGGPRLAGRRRSSRPPTRRVGRRLPPRRLGAPRPSHGTTLGAGGGARPSRRIAGARDPWCSGLLARALFDAAGARRARVARRPLEPAAGSRRGQQRDAYT